MKVKETATAYVTKHKSFTYQDYLDLPEDGKRYQVINGELIMTPAPSINHQFISRNLEVALYLFVEENALGEILHAPVDLVLTNNIVLQPDILFIARERLDIITRQNITSAPDLVVEILSPATGYYDLVEKKTIYSRFGVKEYWIIDPMKKWLEIYSNQDGQFELFQRLDQEGVAKSELLQGFEIALSDIFQAVRA